MKDMSCTHDWCCKLRQKGKKNLAVLTGDRIKEGFFTRKCMAILPGGQREVTALPRCPQGRVSLYVYFYMKSLYAFSYTVFKSCVIITLGCLRPFIWNFKTWLQLKSIISQVIPLQSLFNKLLHLPLKTRSLQVCSYHTNHIRNDT